MKLHHLAYEITRLVNDIEKPETNDSQLQSMLYGYAVYTILSNAAKKHKRFEDEIKEENKEKLEEPCEQFLINEIPQVKVFAKVTNPRKTFDKDEFIKAVSDKYDISAFELHEIAANCEKRSAAPVSLSCEVIDVISGS
jgi:hypothetical protein